MNLMSSQATSSTPTQPLSSSTCCDSGRPIITDPLTGQTVCSCQYDSQAQQLLNYQRLASGLPLNVYGAPYGEQSYLPLTAEQSAFYAPSENIGTWPYPASMYYPYDPTLSGYPFANGYGVDLNGARRKNATRETTSTLKAWLSEHRKNPYPTKGEKIMLAIITKMTLTQVSTWFANARRRLKKENKVTWEPRNRVDDDDNDDASDTNERDPTKTDKEAKNNENGFSSSCQKPGSLSGACDNSDSQRNKGIDVEHDDLCLGNGGTMDTSQRDSMSSPSSSILSDSHSSLQSPMLAESPGTGLTPTDVQGNSLKPRIWSIVDTATSHGNTNTNFNNNFVGFGVNGAGLFGGGGGGPAVKVSQQFARNLRLGYASPYTKAAWLNGAFAATVASSMPLTSSPVAATLSSSSSTTSLSPSSSSAYPSSVCTASPTSSSSAPMATNNGQSVEVSALMRNSIVKSTMAAAAAAGSTTAAPPSSATSSSTSSSSSSSYPMSIAAAAAAAAHSNANMNVNSTLFGRTYAQTIHNLSNLTKGLNHLMAPQLGNAYMGPMKTSPVQQDQRSELQSSTS